jgi:hypothetical protein
VINLSGEIVCQSRAIACAIGNVGAVGTELKTVELYSMPLTKTVQVRIELPYLFERIGVDPAKFYLR